MWGIIPAAGEGTRIQPLAFSKELLPVGGTKDGGKEQPRAVSEYIMDRLVLGGATKICIVISPRKTDILTYYRSQFSTAALAYTVQPLPSGLCDALFRATHLVHPAEPVLIGLPDTIWFPIDGLATLATDQFSFLLFPVEQPERFDAVVTDEQDRVLRIDVKKAQPSSHWIWGAMKMPGRVYHELHQLWLARGRSDEYLGSLVNTWIAAGGRAYGVKRGKSYSDVGTLTGYREAMQILGEKAVRR
ncbi:MAG: nucleotidyltransferase family protein [Verrucomicrobia bacterium]|nr:nucleotidyltransferase family protein [Verrucomicrobiota bacterium]